LNALEYRLVDAVCDVGVNVNKSCTYDHLAPLLAFVGGLGLRKADAMRQTIRKQIGHIDNRSVLLKEKILGKSVWTNAAGFLIILDESDNDPLESTRIHPECYLTHDFATKICADALELHHDSVHYQTNVTKLMSSVRRELEKRIKKHPRWVDLWVNFQRPIIGVTQYVETVRTVDGLIHTLGVEIGDALFNLELDDYVKELEEGGHGKRKLLIEQIKEELRYPCLDMRMPMKSFTPIDMFPIITGESNNSLYVGLTLTGTVVEVNDAAILKDNSDNYQRRQRAVVNTGIGLRGIILGYDVVDDDINIDNLNMSDYLSVGKVIQAVVIGVRKDKLQLDLSIKPSLLSRSEAWWLQQRTKLQNARNWWSDIGKDPTRLFDPYFNEDVALKHFMEAEKVRQSSTADVMSSRLHSISIHGGGGGSESNTAVEQRGSSSGRSLMRVVHHALFANLDYLAAEARLRMEGKGAGEVLIRPSSRGPNYLTITWAFQDNWFKHINIEEKGKKIGSMGLGSQLFIQEDDIREPFSDLDEIFARYIDPMNELVSVTVKHRSFMAGSPAEVESLMLQQRKEKPQRIPYFIRFEPNKPGTLTLTWLSLNIRSEQPVKTQRIDIRPYVSLYMSFNSC